MVINLQGLSGCRRFRLQPPYSLVALRARVLPALPLQPGRLPSGLMCAFVIARATHTLLDLARCLISALYASWLYLTITFVEADNQSVCSARWCRGASRCCFTWSRWCRANMSLTPGSGPTGLCQPLLRCSGLSRRYSLLIVYCWCPVCHAGHVPRTALGNAVLLLSILLQSARLSKAPAHTQRSNPTMRPS